MYTSIRGLKVQAIEPLTSSIFILTLQIFCTVLISKFKGKNNVKCLTHYELSKGSLVTTFDIEGFFTIECL